MIHQTSKYLFVYIVRLNYFIICSSEQVYTNNEVAEKYRFFFQFLTLLREDIAKSVTYLI